MNLNSYHSILCNYKKKAFLIYDATFHPKTSSYALNYTSFIHQNRLK